jgi:hypothetical protein
MTNNKEQFQRENVSHFLLDSTTTCTRSTSVFELRAKG